MRKVFILAAMLLSSIGSIAQNTAKNCYRGYVDAGYSVGIGDYDLGRFEVNTSHGYQINPYLFIGAGTGLHFMPSYKTKDMDIPLDVRDSKVDIPVFANIRCNLLKNKVSPFVDIKGGTYVTNNGGLYVNASAGCRFSINEKQAINLSVGYAIEKLQFETFDSFINHTSMDYTRYTTLYDTEAVTIKLGFAF